jgi:hypothetical protein
MQAARHSQSIENTVFILAIAPHLQQNDDHSADEPFIVLSMAFTEFVEALAAAENFKKRERIPCVENGV